MPWKTVVGPGIAMKVKMWFRPWISALRSTRPEAKSAFISEAKRSQFVSSCFTTV